MCIRDRSKWFGKYAKEEGIDLDYEETRKIIYGMSYSEWKQKYQTEASGEQINKFNDQK